MKIEPFIESLIEKVKMNGRYSTANTYAYTLHSYQKFTKCTSNTFESITPEMIKGYEQSLLLSGRRHNTISLYMRILRSICNQAVDQQIASLDTTELFRNVFIGNEPTAKRAIRPDILHKLVEADLSKKPTSDFTRDLFLLSFYLRGIPFVDLAYLRKSDLKENSITYFRRKTGQQLQIALESCARKIIRKYANQCTNSTYLLPIITSSGEQGHKQYRSALRLYNKRLLLLSEELELKTKLTSYVARHSWATTARRRGIPISIISVGMGHSSEQVTSVYLDSFDDKTLSDANKKVIATVNFKKIKK